MPSYELLYFPARGRGEQIRVMFALNEVEFTENPLGNWPEVKPTIQFQRLPVLTERDGDDEFTLPESGAIMRHLARKFSMYGDGERDHAKCDALADFVADERSGLINVAYAATVGTTEEQIAKYWEQLPQALGNLERSLAASRNPDAGWFIGDAPTFADVATFDYLDALQQLKADALEGHPGLESFMAQFRAQPVLASFLAERNRP